MLPCRIILIAINQSNILIPLIVRPVLNTEMKRILRTYEPTIRMAIKIDHFRHRIGPWLRINQDIIFTGQSTRDGNTLIIYPLYIMIPFFIEKISEGDKLSPTFCFSLTCGRRHDVYFRFKASVL